MLFEETDLGRLETYINSIGTFKVFLANINVKQLTKVLKSRKADKVNEPTGIQYATKEISGEYSSKHQILKLSELQSIFAQCKEIQNEFPSFEVFAENLRRLAEQNISARTDIAVNRCNLNSVATMVLQRTDDEENIILKKIPKFAVIPLNTNFSASTYMQTEADAWLLERLCKDAQGQLYWRFKTPIEDYGCVYPIPIRLDRGSKVIDDDSKFWECFFDQESESITQLFIQIDRYTKSFYAGINEMPEVAGPQFEMGLRSFCPTFIINSINIGFLWREINKTTIQMEATFRLKNQSSFDRVAQQDVFKSTLLKAIPLSRLTTIKVFDDVASNAVHKLPSRPIFDCVPVSHPRLIDYGCPTWDNYLHSTSAEGSTKFPSQRMGELRLAKAVVSICDKNDYSRQILALAGEGNDGKTICLDALKGIIGDHLVKGGRSQSDLGSEFGWQSSINKRLVIFDDIADPYKFFNHEDIKKISGGNSQTIFEAKRKFLEPWNWSTSGCKIIMSANKPYSLYDDATITRCMPLVFLKNYTYKNILDNDELLRGLIAEGSNFIRWCYAVCLYYNTVKNTNGDVCPLFLGAHMKEFTTIESMFSFIGKNLIICSDEQFDLWMQGLLDLSPDNVSIFRAQRNEAFATESQIPHKATPFITLKQEDSEESEVNEYFDALCEVLFTLDENAVLKSSDFSLQMLDFICMKDVEAVGDHKLQQIYRLLRACGFNQLRTQQTLVNSRLWINFKQFICDKYNVMFKCIKRTGKSIRGAKGLSMLNLNDLQNNQISESQTQDNVEW